MDVEKGIVCRVVPDSQYGSLTLSMGYSHTFPLAEWVFSSLEHHAPLALELRSMGLGGMMLSGEKIHSASG